MSSNLALLLMGMKYMCPHNHAHSAVEAKHKRASAVSAMRIVNAMKVKGSRGRLQCSAERAKSQPMSPALSAGRAML